MTSKKPLTVQEMAAMGGRARAAKLSPEQKSEIGSKAVAAREADRALLNRPSLEDIEEDRRQLMREEYRARYADEVLAELRMRESDWKDEYPAKRRQFRNELRQQLEEELWEKVKELFPKSRKRGGRR